jgi:hypothetical protein
MSNEAILRKAIEKAHANGYKPRMTVEQIIAHNNQFLNPIAIIFTHDFAKAFFGHCAHIDEDDWGGCGLCGVGDWHYQLQQMVTEEKTLKIPRNVL